MKPAIAHGLGRSLSVKSGLRAGGEVVTIPMGTNKLPIKSVTTGK